MFAKHLKTRFGLTLSAPLLAILIANWGCSSDDSPSSSQGGYAGLGGTAGTSGGSGGLAGSAGQVGAGGQGGLLPGLAFFVAPTGNDENVGTESKPFRTLERARDEVRNLTANMDGDITVYLRGGVHERMKTFELTSLDSGKNGHDVVWSSYPGEQAIIEGGTAITGWVPDKGSVFKANVPGNISDFRQLYANGKRQQRARSEKTYTAAKFLADNKSKHYAMVVDKTALSGLTKLTDAEVLYVGVNVKGHGVIKNGKEIVRPSWNSHRLPVDMVQNHNTTQSRLVIGSDAKTKSAKLSPLSHASQRGFDEIRILASDPFFLENVPELLDKPGEFYFDKATSTVFWWPPKGVDPKTASVWVPRVEVLLDLNGTPEQRLSRLRFEKLAFRHSTYLLPQSEGSTVSQGDRWFTGHEPDDWLTDKGTSHSSLSSSLPSGLPAAAIELDSVTEVRFSDLAVAHLGSAGVLMHNDVSKTVFERCLFSDISGSGIIAGHPDHEFIDEPMEGLTKDVRIVNSRIEHVGVEYLTGAGVALFKGEEFVIEHSEIVDAAYLGISYGWGWDFNDPATNHRRNKVLYTYFERTMHTLYDGAPLYLLGPSAGYGDPESESTQLIGNYSDNSSVKQHFPGYDKHPGIQLDKGSRNAVMRDNVFIGSTQWFQLTRWYANQTNPAWIAGRGLSGKNNYSDATNWTTSTGSTPSEKDLPKLKIEAVKKFDPKTPPPPVKAIRAKAGIPSNVTLPPLP